MTRDTQTLQEADGCGLGWSIMTRETQTLQEADLRTGEEYRDKGNTDAAGVRSADWRHVLTEHANTGVDAVSWHTCCVVLHV